MNCWRRLPCVWTCCFANFPTSGFLRGGWSAAIRLIRETGLVKTISFRARILSSLQRGGFVLRGISSRSSSSSLSSMLESEKWAESVWDLVVSTLLATELAYYWRVKKKLTGIGALTGAGGGFSVSSIFNRLVRLTGSLCPIGCLRKVSGLEGVLSASEIETYVEIWLSKGLSSTAVFVSCAEGQHRSSEPSGMWIRVVVWKSEFSRVLA